MDLRFLAKELTSTYMNTCEQFQFQLFTDSP